jgi:hypothetical protein
MPRRLLTRSRLRHQHPPFQPDGCAFCLQSGNRVRTCPTASECVRSGRTSIQGNRISLPNGQPIPNDGTGRGRKHGIDTRLAAQAQAVPASTQQVSFARETPPHFPSSRALRAPSSRIEEVTEAHLMQILYAESDPE